MLAWSAGPLTGAVTGLLAVPLGEVGSSHEPKVCTTHPRLQGLRLNDSPDQFANALPTSPGFRMRAPLSSRIPSSHPRTSCAATLSAEVVLVLESTTCSLHVPTARVPIDIC